jgi:hypothetical protein
MIGASFPLMKSQDLDFLVLFLFDGNYSIEVLKKIEFKENGHGRVVFTTESGNAELRLPFHNL